MNVVVTENHEESSIMASQIIANLIKAKPNATLGLATGGTVEKVYEALVNMYKKSELSFKDIKTINLDEYIGLSPSHSQSYRYFMNYHFFNNIDIDIKNTYLPKGDANNLEEELEIFKNMLNTNKRDFQLLGIGPNGHIAFNEPDSTLHANAFIVSIAQSTIKANGRFFESINDVPKKAFTQGMGDILKAKKIVLIATGENKVDAIRKLISNDDITTECPATFIKAHRDVTVFIDKSLKSKI